eukprot:CAMPEP_0177643366 /NCGR_PEP_ID=MMETSP0447-20121125/8117_1 /TAXON_ID=0 /ORGANISM="Stygamoeba regulata, Strain BSH-02190019" /LENGTH=394 /DNA_ID=CAMNT_0019145657 /DNA_START=25 /DNA_END=1205 /DNA_ORIENTATION=+
MSPSLNHSSTTNFASALLPSGVLHRKLKLVEGASNRADVPAEQENSLVVGVGVHLGPIAVFVAALLYVGVTVPNVFMCGLGSMLIDLAAILWHEGMHPAADLPRASFKDVWVGVVLVFFTGVFLGSTVIMVLLQVAHRVLGEPSAAFDWWYVAYAVMLDDFLYYSYHRWLSHSAARHAGSLLAFFQRIHMPHHAVECLDFWRGNLSSVWDTAVCGFQLPLVGIALLYSLPLPATMAAYFIVLLLQATHHCNHTFNIGALRFVFVDNHAHKMHHCPWGNALNLGACFAMWDRNLGTFYEDWSLSTNYAQLHKVQLNVRPQRALSNRDTACVYALIVGFFLLPVFMAPAHAATITVVLSCTLAPASKGTRLFLTAGGGAPLPLLLTQLSSPAGMPA